MPPAEPDERRRSSRPVVGLGRLALAPFLFVGKVLVALYGLEVLVLVSLLPLSAVLLLVPAAIPDESVIADTAARAGGIRGLLRRQFNLLVGLAAFVALVGFATVVEVRAGAAGRPLAIGGAVPIAYA